MQPAKRADVEDPSASRAEVGMGGFGHQEGRAGVGGEHRVPLLDGDVLQGFGLEDAGVIDEKVELAELFDHRRHRLLDALWVAEIAAHGQRVDVMGRQRADCFFRFRLGAEVGDRYVRAAFRQRQGDRAADTLGRSGNEHGLSL